MEPVISGTKGSISRDKQTNDLSLTLFNRLLTTLLTNQNKTILFQSSSQNFMYDTGKGMGATGMLQATVKNKKIIEKENEIEITLSGIIKNRQGHGETYTLYFFIWWDQTLISPTQESWRKTVGRDLLLIDTESASQYLSDSIFELDLHRTSPSSEQSFPGQGRGYLVFGRET